MQPVIVSAIGITYEVMWKATGTYKPVESPSASISLPISNPKPTFFTSSTRCKSGRACIKGTSCPNSHTKLCTWVNAPQGCTKDMDCEFSHGLEWVRCTQNTTRKACSSLRGHAFKHGANCEEVDGGEVEQADSTSSRTLLSNVPVGPKIGVVPPIRVKVNDTSIA